MAEPPLRPADSAFVATLRRTLPAAAFPPLTGDHLSEPRGRWRGRAGVLVAPSATAEVAEVVRAAALARVPVVPVSGGTGLVGGQIMEAGPAPVLLSLARMTRIRETYPRENVLVAEAGAILADVQAAAGAAGRRFPLSLASEGTARIGGLLAANAGGVGVIRHGNARDLTLGIEAVLPDGQVLHGLRRLRKDNAGYDLRHLLIGAEGTLGVITAAALRLAPVPAVTGSALFTVQGPGAALDLLALAGERHGGQIEAFELISGTGLDFLAETMPGIRRPLEPHPPWMALVELGLAADQDAGAALAGLYESAEASGLATDGVIAASEAQRAALWRMREAIPEANRLIGAVSSHDISLPLSGIPRFIRQAGPAIAAIGPFRVNCFGHLRDGNLHYNTSPPPGGRRQDHEAARERVKRTVHDLVHALGGSIAAEHGIGRLKVADLERYADPAGLAAMRAIKTALDPAGIMNPGAVLRRGGA